MTTYMNRHQQNYICVVAVAKDVYNFVNVSEIYANLKWKGQIGATVVDNLI